MQVECPTPMMHVLVRGQGSGSAGTICVTGNNPVTLAARRGCLLAIWEWLKSPSLRRPRRLSVTDSSLYIRVRLLPNFVGTSGQQPDWQPGDTDTAAAPHWCAAPVPLPAGTVDNGPLTAVVWLLRNDPTSPHPIIVDGPRGVPFYGGGPNPCDCCAYCSSGSSSGGGMSAMAAELAAHPPLEASVPDGPNAGRHRAHAVAFLTWQFAVGGRTYTLGCAGGNSLLLRGPSASALPAALEWGPFSAVFPGELLGSAGDVVVTVA